MGNVVQRMLGWLGLGWLTDTPKWRQAKQGASPPQELPQPSTRGPKTAGKTAGKARPLLRRQSSLTVSLGGVPVEERAVTAEFLTWLTANRHACLQSESHSGDAPVESATVISCLDMYSKVVHPLTQRGGERRFCDLQWVLDHRENKSWFGPADYFVTYASDDGWQQLVELLCTHSAEVVAAGLPPPHYWLDQFAVTGRESGNGLDSAGSRDPTCAFRRAVRRAGKALIVMGDWAAPTILSRRWPIFEIWTAVTEGANVDVLLSSPARRKLHAVLAGGAMAVAERAMRQVVPLAGAPTRHAEDGKRILAVVQANVGEQDVDVVHETVGQMLMQWLASEGLAVVAESGGVDTADVRLMSAVARILRDDGDSLDEVVRLLSAVVQRLEAAGEGSAAIRLRAVSDLGVALRKQGKLAYAEPLLRQTLAQRQALLGDHDSASLASMASLAALLEDKGDLDEAIDLSMQILALREGSVGKDHPRTISAAQQLARRLARYGSYAAAEPLLRRCFDATRAAKGPRHPDSLELGRQLANTVRRKQRRRSVVRLQQQ